MKIDMYKYLETGKFIEHAVLNMLGDSKKMKQIIKYDKGKKVLPIDMVFTMNGVEVSIECFFEYLEGQFEGCVKKEAEVYLDDKMHGKLTGVTELLEKIEKYIKKEAVRVGIKEEEDYL